jgi:hypothetical protein
MDKCQTTTERREYLLKFNNVAVMGLFLRRIDLLMMTVICKHNILLLFWGKNKKEALVTRPSDPLN